MIIAKPREDSKLFKGLTYLEKRTQLRQDSRKQLINLEKGILGEEFFGSLVKKYLNSDVLVLHDLLLIHNGSTFQIDSLLISSTKVFLYEIKNYQGNYTNEQGHFMTASGKEINNPSTQLKRTETLLRKLLLDLDFDFDVEGYTVFTNPSFYLYQAVKTDPFIFSPQFENHFREVNNQSKTLKKVHYYLSDKLIQIQREEAPYQKQLPEYNYSEFRKGLSCIKCSCLATVHTQRTVHCLEYGHRNDLSDTIVKNIDQFVFLFPDKRLTSSMLSDWMGHTINKKRLARILNKEYARVGCSKGTYYRLR